MKFTSSLKLKLIYVFRINDEAHRGCLKIGETTSDEEDIWGLAPNSAALNKAGRKRIDQYTQTAAIPYDLLYTEVTIYNRGTLNSFSDSEVHQILIRSGIKKKVFDTKNKANEWFITDLETVKKAIAAVKDGRQSLLTSEISTDQSPVEFRPEQKDAIEKTKKQFKKSNEMLWFAKMRFGKTLSALQVAKEHDFNRTLILTHRPVVDAGWFEDFGKVFYDKPNFQYGSKKKNGSDFAVLEKQCKIKKTQYIFFASMQDLRGSSLVGGNFDKNDEIFTTQWDFIIIDEAHEGTQTELGRNVLTELKKENTKVLHLSGTPFNLLDNYKEEEIFTWDYVMEQRAKANWDKIHFGDPNPYASLPKLNIFTYNLGNILKSYKDEEVAFNFREFFRVNENGNFLHEKDVLSFLNIICKENAESNYPFANAAYRDNFRHSLWMVPGVKEARALEKLLNVHPVFSLFTIANVAGDGNEEEANSDALKKVEKAIGHNPHETFSITLSCGRLTTGVSVKPWTAVFMLSGSYNTSASTYMQTIFRVQTPATINGKVKEECFVFDFAPDRTLKVIAETAKISAKAGKTSDDDRDVMGDFLNFCPIIAVEGSQMKTYDVNSMLEQLKKVYVERVVQNGFEDNHLYNQDHLMKLGGMEIDEFNGLKEIIGTTKAMPKTKDIEINRQGLDKEEYEKIEKAKKKKQRELTDEEKQLLEKEAAYKKLRDTAISILRGISIRMPLLIYGAEVGDEEKELSIDNFTELVDDQSWQEFMPNGVSKQVFKKFKKYYEPDVFRAAGRKIRAMARATDQLTVEERITRITAIFANFRNPDKETILTPWRVVNMHLSDCLGGYVFLDDKREKTIELPIFTSQGEVTENVFASDSKVLEINSKSGLYPLYMAYSIFRNRAKEQYPNQTVNELTVVQQQALWDKTLTENLFVLCKTPMAKSITKRTLAGFRHNNVNARFFEDLVHQITDRPDKFIEKIKKGQTYWKGNNNNDMTFNAIVGNPPYQEMDGGNSESSKPLYNHFVEISKKIKPNFISLIMPARWYAGGKGLDSFRESMLKDSKMSTLFDYPNSNDCFTNVDIAGGLCYFLWDSNHQGDCRITNNINNEIISKTRPLNDFEILIRDNKALPILHKVISWNKKGLTLTNRVSSRKPFGLPTNYEAKEEGIPCWFIQKIGLKYAKPEDVVDSQGYLGKWKLLTPKSPIAGQTDFTKAVGFYYDGNTRIAKPGECCTESFIVAAAFDTEQELLSFKSYLFTKAVRFLLLQMVISQDVTKKCFGFIPDFDKYEGRYTDKQLCNLWGISDEEWKYIDSRIKDIKG
mgnify:CR=1 FL=1